MLPVGRSGEMGCEYVISPRDGDPLPQPDEVERILMDMPDFFGKVQYPQDIAYEYRSGSTLDTSKMPHMHVVISDPTIVICTYGYKYLHELIGRLCDHVASESAHEEARVVRP